jgi:hypothetical protein
MKNDLSLNFRVVRIRHKIDKTEVKGGEDFENPLQLQA